MTDLIQRIRRIRDEFDAPVTGEERPCEQFFQRSRALTHIRRSRADASKLLHSGHLINALINSVISDKS
jgi:hypothetical protein